MSENSITATFVRTFDLTRRRRVLLFADIVESVRLMNLQEANVIARWLRFVEVVQSELLPAHTGRLVKSHGDGLLLEFEDAVSALRTAEKMHVELAVLNSGLDASACLALRIGVHVAEVVVQSFDLFGVGVNLVARIAALAGAGHTIVSAEVRDDLSQFPEWQLEDLGPCFLKHFDAPIRAYRIASASSAGRPTLDWISYRPAVAVIPFMPRLPGDGPEVMGDAIADDIIAALSGQRELRVISRLSTACLRGDAAPLTNSLEILKARFILTGRFALRGETVQLSVQLSDARSGQVLWTEALTALAADIFHGQDAAIPTIVRLVSQSIMRTEMERARTLPIPSMDDYSLYLGAVGMMHRMARYDFLVAKELLEHLIARHPRSAAPRAQLAKWHVLELAQGWASERNHSALAAESHALRALDLDPDQALALAMRAACIGHAGGNLEVARQLAQQATEADPQEPHAWLSLGAVNSWLGDAQPAEELPLRAVALSPLDPARYLFDVFVAAGKLAVGKTNEAAIAARASVEHNAMHLPSHKLLIVALVLDGKIDEARKGAGRLLCLEPSFRVSDYLKRYAGRDQPHARVRADAMRAAGLPD